jgi:hypothetical protein
MTTFAPWSISPRAPAAITAMRLNRGQRRALAAFNDPQMNAFFALDETSLQIAAMSKHRAIIQCSRLHVHIHS